VYSRRQRVKETFGTGLFYVAKKGFFFQGSMQAQKKESLKALLSDFFIPVELV
jgi:hypothetical protein